MIFVICVGVVVKIIKSFLNQENIRTFFLNANSLNIKNFWAENTNQLLVFFGQLDSIQELTQLVNQFQYTCLYFKVAIKNPRTVLVKKLHCYGGGRKRLNFSSRTLRYFQRQWSGAKSFALDFRIYEFPFCKQVKSGNDLNFLVQKKNHIILIVKSVNAKQ